MDLSDLEREFDTIINVFQQSDPDGARWARQVKVAILPQIHALLRAEREACAQIAERVGAPAVANDIHARQEEHDSAQSALDLR